MIGEKVSHYKIIDKLGSGGMGEVYKAEDTKLKRTVALKFLPSSFSFDKEAKKRFTNEAQSASALDHPNICTIHEIGETVNGQLFISMACYEGATLKEKIEKGVLNIDEAIDITLQICEGLKKAHQNKITHRDIKPANIFITKDGVVKILDFGLAKTKGQSHLTQMGTTIGTIAPEQTRGEEVDQRTDIWSLGVVIYEMLTGKLPFKGDYDQAIIYSILNEEPDLSNLPKEIMTVIKRAIDKSPKERYQNVEEVINDLVSLKGSSTKKYHLLVLPRRIGSKTKTIASAILLVIVAVILYFVIKPFNDQVTTPERKMIVVLPFENLGPSEDEYFAQGMREEISNKLASLGSIGVISRSSAEKFANTKKTAKEIGKELGVDYILEGTVQWAKSNGKVNRVRIFPQLVRVSDDVSIWSDSYDRVIDDIFRVQNEIAQNVVDKLGIKILPAQFNNETPPTKNLDAYDFYLKANQMKYRISSKADVYASIRLYENAIALDSNFAAAHAQLSISYMGVYDRYYDRSNIIIEKIKSHLQKAEKLDSNLADVHLAKAFYSSMIKHDEGEALKEFNRTLRIQPNNAEVFMSLAIIYWSRGDFGLDLKYSLKALNLDPLSSRYAENVGGSYRWQRKYENAEKYFNRAIELTPDFEDYYRSLISLYIDWKGNTKDAWTVFEKLKDKKPENTDLLLITLNIYDKNFKTAINKLESLKTEYANDGAAYIPNSQMIALIYRYMKEYNLSKKYFEISIEQLKKKLLADSTDFRIYNSLSVCYAGLNNKEKALEQIKRGTNLNPFKEQSYFKFSRMLSFAEVYTLVGDYDNAIKQIDTILSKPGYFSVNRLKINPLFDPLRNLPGYKTLIEKYSD
ncbi:MAG: protein kinase [Ignavibacteriaceae bacterium]